MVQTGVKSFGWENSSAQPSPIHSWKLIAPSVVSAVKSGAVSLIRSPMGFLRCWRTARRLAKHGDYSDQISQESFQTVDQLTESGSDSAKTAVKMVIPSDSLMLT